MVMNFLYKWEKPDYFRLNDRSSPFSRIVLFLKRNNYQKRKATLLDNGLNKVVNLEGNYYDNLINYRISNLFSKLFEFQS